jgi:hypothetical protein
MRSARIGVIALIVPALLSACSSSKPTPIAQRAPTSFADLESRIVTQVPSGFAAQPDDKYDTGPSDLAKAIRDDGEPGAGKVLRSAGFVRGYQRIWIGPDDAQIIVFVYQYASSAGARRAYARDTQGSHGKVAPTAHKFEVTDLPTDQATGVAGTAEDGGAFALAYFTTGVFNVEINCNGPKLAGLQERATSVAEHQLRRL